MARQTPMRRQYLRIKAQYPDCILLFRLGDFYEMFDADAELAAQVLDITLTTRSPGKNSEKIPMAGVPYHAVDSYIVKLIEQGYHVAVCDQVTEPTGRGIVEREVTRVLTPGTVVEAGLLDAAKSNYLMGILPIGDPATGKWAHAGIAYADISTGEFCATQLAGDDLGLRVFEELARLTPREVLLPESWVERGVTLPPGTHLSAVQDWTFELDGARRILQEHFRVATLGGFGLQEQPHAIAAAGAVLQYLRSTQRANLAQLSSIRAYSTESFMVLDPFTRRNLELHESIRGASTRGSLIGILDRSATAMGARLLRRWLSQPLLEISRLNARLDAVQSLLEDEQLRASLRLLLREVADIERLSNRVVAEKAQPRDLLSLRKSLSLLPGLRAHTERLPKLHSLHEQLDPCTEALDLLERSIAEQLPATSSTGLIRRGYAKELDALVDATQGARDWIAGLEKTERERTGIPSLKVRYNKVFGYYIEVTHAHTSRVPDDYLRKQTLVNAERYITPELKEYETRVLNAEDDMLRIERRLFGDICQQIGNQRERLLKTANAVAHLDAFQSLAEVAMREGYTRPQLSEDNALEIKGGRHPVVEKLLESSSRFVANDSRFDMDSRIHIITGPNMSGKSTYIRQVALITLMAQLGSFVPADSATIGLVDRIFARIGAQDEIHSGQSTFMVEMVETARLLAGSGPRSLLILDEVGRGTSTYDGMAIARAVIEYIHNNPRLNCRTLFATHYHELTELPNILPRTKNYNVAVAEQGEQIVFLHHVVPGGADQSYGVHVAQLAGMPQTVVTRARQLLAHLEQGGGGFSTTPVSNERQQLNFLGAAESPALQRLRTLEVDGLSPLEALTTLYELKRLVDES